MWRKLKKAAQLPASIEISGTLRDMDSAPESQFRGLLVKLSENLNAVENPKEFENVLELLKAQNVIGKLSALARADVTTISDPPLLHATLSCLSSIAFFGGALELLPVTPALVGMLTSSDASTQMYAAAALQNITSYAEQMDLDMPDVADLQGNLVELADDDDPAVAGPAAAALENLARGRRVQAGELPPSSALQGASAATFSAEKSWWKVLDRAAGKEPASEAGSGSGDGDGDGDGSCSEGEDSETDEEERARAKEEDAATWLQKVQRGCQARIEADGRRKTKAELALEADEAGDWKGLHGLLRSMDNEVLKVVDPKYAFQRAAAAAVILKGFKCWYERNRQTPREPSSPEKIRMEKKLAEERRRMEDEKAEAAARSRWGAARGGMQNLRVTRAALAACGIENATVLPNGQLQLRAVDLEKMMAAGLVARPKATPKTISGECYTRRYGEELREAGPTLATQAAADRAKAARAKAEGRKMQFVSEGQEVKLSGKNVIQLAAAARKNPSGKVAFAHEGRQVVLTQEQVAKLERAVWSGIDGAPALVSPAAATPRQLPFTTNAAEGSNSAGSPSRSSGMSLAIGIDSSASGSPPAVRNFVGRRPPSRLEPLPARTLQPGEEL